MRHSARRSWRLVREWASKESSHLFYVGNRPEGFERFKDFELEVVARNSKQRFAYDDSGTRIRANQGHSIAVDVELKETVRGFGEILEGKHLHPFRIDISSGCHRISRARAAQTPAARAASATDCSARRRSCSEGARPSACQKSRSTSVGALSGCGGGGSGCVGQSAGTAARQFEAGVPLQ